jgi:hypothetical protein
MNEAKRQEVLQPVYPTYVQANYIEDEINLVDVWISLKQKRRLFFMVFLPLLLLGLLFGLFIYHDKYELVTTIQIGTMGKDGNIQPIESPGSLLNKIKSAMAPQALQDFLQKHSEFDSFDTNISNPKNSDIIVISNKILPDNLGLFTTFQQDLAASIVSDHARQIEILQADDVLALKQAKFELEKLQDPETLADLLRKPQIQLEAAQTRLEKLQQSYQQYLQNGKAGMLRKIRMEELKKLSPASEEPSDQLLDLQYEQLLLDSQLAIDEQNLNIAELKLTIDRVSKEHTQAIEEQHSKVSDLESRLENFNRTRIIGKPVLSVKPVGLSRIILFPLLFLIVFFISFAVILVSIFRDKVHQREMELG